MENQHKKNIVTWKISGENQITPKKLTQYWVFGIVNKK